MQEMILDLQDMAKALSSRLTVLRRPRVEGCFDVDAQAAILTAHLGTKPGSLTPLLRITVSVPRIPHLNIALRPDLHSNLYFRTRSNLTHPQFLTNWIPHIIPVTNQYLDFLSYDWPSIPSNPALEPHAAAIDPAMDPAMDPATDSAMNPAMNSAMDPLCDLGPCLEEEAAGVAEHRSRNVSSPFWGCRRAAVLTITLYRCLAVVPHGCHAGGVCCDAQRSADVLESEDPITLSFRAPY
ncbi:hypothetical protein VTG60DRAFT_3868 [Thermothelomyces hinnuleus]